MENSEPVKPEAVPAVKESSAQETAKEVSEEKLIDEAPAPAEILSGAMATQHATTTGH